MRKIFLALTLFSSIFISNCIDCSDSEESNYLFNKKYECVLKKEIKSPDDSITHFISYCSIGKFEKALEIYSVPYNYRIIGSWQITEEIDTVKYKYYSINDFPYSNFSSRQLFMFSQYFNKKYNCKKELVNKLLTESLKKDSTNFYSMYDLTILLVESMDLNKAKYLSDKLIKNDFWEKKVKELNGLIEKYKTEKEYHGASCQNINEVLESGAVFPEYLNGFYDRHKI